MSDDSASLSREGTLQLIDAASVSPTASHVLPSLTASFLIHAGRESDGHQRVRARHLADVVSSGRQEAERLQVGLHEDFTPLDVRREVLTRWSGGLFRLVPGGFEAPVSVLEAIRIEAVALDPWLESELGFGMRDLVELALRRMDEVVAVCAAHWHAQVDQVGATPSISEREVTALRGARSLRGLTSECSHPDRARRALEWATLDHDEALDNFRSSGHTLGPALRVKAHRKTHEVPAGLLLDAVYEAVGALRHRASRSPRVRAATAGVSRDYVLGHLSLLGDVQTDVPVVDGELTAVVACDPDLLLAVEVVPQAASRDAVSQAAKRLASFSPETAKPDDGDPGAWTSTDRTVRLLVTFGVTESVELLPRTPHQIHFCEAQAVRWMVSSSKRPDDLAHFLWDRQDERGRAFSWSLIDEWEVWRTGDVGPFAHGVEPTATIYSAHAEESEWQRHAELAWLERALLVLDLPHLAAWQTLDLEHADEYVAYGFNASSGFETIIIAGPEREPAAVVAPVIASRPIPPHRIARAIAWRLRHLPGEVLAIAARDAAGFRVMVHPESAGPDGAQAGRSGQHLVLWYPDPPDPEEDAFTGDEVAAELEESIGSALAEALESLEARDTFRHAWQSAPPGLAIDTRRARPSDLASQRFEAAHPSVRSRERRDFARWLAQSRVEPGRRVGDAAVALEGDLHNHLLVRLKALLQRLDDCALEDALEDLDRLHAERVARQGEIDRLGRLHADAGTGHDLEELRETDIAEVTQRLAVAVIVEHLIALDGSGSERYRGELRSQLLAVAELLVESGRRKDALHYGLAETSIEVSDSYQVTLQAGTNSLDIDGLHRALLATGMEPETEWDTHRDEAIEELRHAFAKDYGFGLDHLGTVLEAAADLPPDGQRVCRTLSMEEFVSEILEVAREEATALTEATAHLTLKSEHLSLPIEHWKMDRRPYRLVTRPFIETDEGLLIAPHVAAYGLDVIMAHLSGFRSPWASSTLPSFNEHLQSLRLARTRRFEKQVRETFRDHPRLVLVESTKQGSRIGELELSREIDALVIDPHRRRLWVIEAKDRTPDFVAPQMERSIRQYIGERGYQEKVATSVRELSEHLPAILTELGHMSPGREWTIPSLFVTSHVEAFAFDRRCSTAFCKINALLSTVDSDEARGRYGVTDPHDPVGNGPVTAVAPD